MAHDDGLTTAALLLGGGLAGYALGHWLDRGDDPVSSPSQVSVRNARSPRAARRYTRKGRTIFRDGVAVIDVVRVDLGDQRYAISPHETDVLTEQIVKLLNRHRAR
jgi:hypothetical protein